MKIILSPAKRMKVDTDTLPWHEYPVFIEKAEQLKAYLQSLTSKERRILWNCNEKIAELNEQRLEKMDLRRGLTPALFAYEGIQYQYLAPIVLEDKEFEYLQENLRILSGFYGILRPFDGVAPYRLEMQAPVRLDGWTDLYQFWGDSLAKELARGTDWVLNLASKEYSKSVLKWLPKEISCTTCVFGEVREGKVVEKGTLVKMARGEMVRFLAKHKIKSPEGLRTFEHLNYQYREELSDEQTYVFIRGES